MFLSNSIDMMKNLLTDIANNYSGEARIPERVNNWIVHPNNYF